MSKATNVTDYELALAYLDKLENELIDIRERVYSLFCNAVTMREAVFRMDRECKRRRVGHESTKVMPKRGH